MPPMLSDYAFSTFSDAFSRSRGYGHPITAWIGAARWKVFPSGRAELDMSVKCLPEHCRTDNVRAILRGMRTRFDWAGKPIRGNKNFWPMLCDALDDAGGSDIANAIREGMKGA